MVAETRPIGCVGGSAGILSAAQLVAVPTVASRHNGRARQTGANYPARSFQRVACTPSSSSAWQRGAGGSALVVRRGEGAVWSTRRQATSMTMAAEGQRVFQQKEDIGNGTELETEVVQQGNDRVGVVTLRGNLAREKMLLHWGFADAGGGDWRLQDSNQWPAGTRNYKNRALQTAFNQTGDNTAEVRLDLSDGRANSVQFILKNEGANTWFKADNGGNYVIPLQQTSGTSTSTSSGSSSQQEVTLPDDLMSLAAYVRWERSGRPNLGPEEQEVQYQASNKDLQDRVRRGETIESIRKSFEAPDSNNNNNNNEKKDEKKDAQTEDEPHVPEELLAVASYIRWEKAGQPNYSDEEQAREYAAAKQDLQQQLRSGVSLQDLEKKLRAGDGGGGSGSSDALAQAGRAPSSHFPKKPKYESVGRINWNLDEIINWHGKKSDKTAEPDSGGKSASPLEEAVSALSAEGAEVMSLQKFELNDGISLVILAEKRNDNTRVIVASDAKWPLVLHWGMVGKDKSDWRQPPSDVLSKDSVAGDKYADSPLGTVNGLAKPFVGLELNLNLKQAKDMDGIVAVLRSEDSSNWFKRADGRDIYVHLSSSMPDTVAHYSSDEIAKWLLDEIITVEPEAMKSFMHRYNLAAGFLERARAAGPIAVAGLFCWLRYTALRQLVWNRNYNVKPRELSTAQDNLTGGLTRTWREQAQDRDLVRLMFGAVGRGGQGDLGQRIRDEILTVQSKNNCKGGMMEEWHQKLHNNTTPDDVVICEALLAYIDSDLDISAYWAKLTEGGVSADRLKSYDRPIVSEPKFNQSQVAGLRYDLLAYLKTLKAVHSGADLESAIASCVGFQLKASRGGQHGNINVERAQGVTDRLATLLEFVLAHRTQTDGYFLLEAVVEAREELLRILKADSPRLKDLLYLDLALESQARTIIEGTLSHINEKPMAYILNFVSLGLENLALSTADNEDLVYSLKELKAIQSLQAKREGHEWALRLKAVSDRIRLSLAATTEHLNNLLQPSAEYLGYGLNCEEWAIKIFSEEIVRAGPAAPLSALLSALDPPLRQAADLGNWQIISPVAVTGKVVISDILDEEITYEEPTILIAARVSGDEEVPPGAVAIITPDMPDVLSHVSVRARNLRVCFATCFDDIELEALRALNGQWLKLTPQASGELAHEVVDKSAATGTTGAGEEAGKARAIKVTRRKFEGKLVVPPQEFNFEVVGGKSANLQALSGKVPDWIRTPRSIALPFGVFDQVIDDPINASIKAKVTEFEKKAGKFGSLPEIRATILGLKPPSSLVSAIKDGLQSAGMSIPRDDFDKAWKAICGVWASKWNDRAWVSRQKAGISTEDVSMAVLIQEIVPADYAFVIHTTNPQNDNKDEVYAEVVRGLGETLVSGVYPGRALSFKVSKGDLDTPLILGYPSKGEALFTEPTLIFRSDSNSEDLEGYAGAGLYDSILMDPEREGRVDYATDKLLNDAAYRQDILTKIGRAAVEVEKAMGSPQDIEGAVVGDEFYLVQTRPQV